MTVAGIELALARREAEANLFDECRVVREARGPLDRATGKHTTVEEWQWTGRCSIRDSGEGAREVVVIGQDVDEGKSILKLPVAATGHLKSGDIAIITKSRFDDSLVGRRFRLTAHKPRTHTTLRRLPVEELT